MRRDGQWLLDRVTEEDVPRVQSNYEQLKQLEWMIGTWVDQDEDDRIETTCQWTKNRNFITRLFAITVRDRITMAGMQIIGWDPARKQIRSWVFDSDGGFGEDIFGEDFNEDRTPRHVPYIVIVIDEMADLMMVSGADVEESVMPRIYRESPVNAVWEGSGNVQALDLLRVLSREPASIEALRKELGPYLEKSEAGPLLNESGLSLAELIRSLEPYPVVALTQKAHEHRGIAAVRAGAQGYICIDDVTVEGQDAGDEAADVGSVGNAAT